MLTDPYTGLGIEYAEQCGMGAKDEEYRRSEHDDMAHIQVHGWSPRFSTI